MTSGLIAAGVVIAVCALAEFCSALWSAWNAHKEASHGPLDW
jgi:hypothetical protein